MIRLIGYFFGLGAVAFLLIAGGVTWYVSGLTKDLPDYEVLSRYEPPVTTRIHAASGDLMREYAHEKRLYLPIQAMPDLLKQAFLSAEDKNFYQHEGIAWASLAKAAFDYGKGKLEGSGVRARGASTITQQVAKNFLLTRDRNVDRKIKEAILSMRIERAYDKDKILELYLNEIFLGLGSYGVAGASLAYFNKSVNELTLPEVAYLAALPKGPNNYHPFRRTSEALERRNWVIDRMVANGYVSNEEADKAKQLDLQVNPRPTGSYLFASEYFAEEVRREIIDRYGQKALYEGGLSIRTTLDPRMQGLARKALMNGLQAYDRKRGFHGPVTNLIEDPDWASDWGKSLAKVERLSDIPEWRLAVVLGTGEDGARIGIRPKRNVDGSTSSDRTTAAIAWDDMKWAGRLNFKDEQPRNVKTATEVFNLGDVVYVSEKTDEEGNKVEGSYELRQIPKVGGAIVAMDPHTGRVLAMMGGFSFAQSQFNRATQAKRQPGSSFKPFVYAAALDNGYTPSSVVLDAPIRINQGRTLGFWEPKNYGGKYAGPSTLRLGIERSRNLMTVRLANDLGMPLVAEYAKRFGIYDKMLPVLSMSLGSGETTVLRMVSAYSVLANGGKAIKPSLIDRIQDRYGKTIFRHEQRVCEACNADTWLGQDEPELIDSREQVLDPMTAYQITSMMEGVVQRGTAVVVSKLGKPIAGKTGTTNDEKDAWFIGYSPDLVVGVYVGFDNPKPMGRGSTGGGLAAPIFTEFMSKALEANQIIDFRVPQGVKLYPINRKTGLMARAGQPGVIMEAFKPGTRPPDTFSIIGFAEELARDKLTSNPEANRAVVGGSGGLY
ncbi:MAG: penicillin-binding protein 1A [Pseudomonadota bacterium]